MYLVEKDDNQLLYCYSSWVDHFENHEVMKNTIDGEITIERSSFPEPEIRIKKIRMRNGRKKYVEKRIPAQYDFRMLLLDKKIIIKNASGTFDTLKYGKGIDVDIMACKLIWKLFSEYQMTGEIKEYIRWSS